MRTHKRTCLPTGEDHRRAQTLSEIDPTRNATSAHRKRGESFSRPQHVLREPSCSSVPPVQAGCRIVERETQEFRPSR